MSSVKTMKEEEFVSSRGLGDDGVPITHFENQRIVGAFVDNAKGGLRKKATGRVVRRVKYLDPPERHPVTFWREEKGSQPERDHRKMLCGAIGFVDHHLSYGQPVPHAIPIEPVGDFLEKCTGVFYHWRKIEQE
jgi:hypothetical protein